MNPKKLLAVIVILMAGTVFLTNCSAPPTTPTPAAPTATYTPVPPRSVVGTITSSNINGKMIFGDTTYSTNYLADNVSGFGFISPEDAWVLDVPTVPKTFTFSTCNVTTTWADDLYLVNSGVTQYGSAANTCGSQASLSIDITIAGRYYLIIDGQTGAMGAYGVTITSP